MKQNSIFVVIQILTTAISFCPCNAQQSKDNLEDTKKAILKSNDTYFQAFAKGDSSIFLDKYTDDCWIMPPNKPVLCGLEASLDFFKTAYYRLGVRNGKFITIDISGDGGGFVTEAGFYRLFDTKNTMLEDGKYLVLWKKTGNGWKRFRDSFSPNQ